MAKPAKVMWDVFRYIGFYKEEHGGNPPTREDIARHFKFSPQAADQHISRLFRKNKITYDDHGRVIQVGGNYDAPDD